MTRRDYKVIASTLKRLRASERQQGNVTVDLTVQTFMVALKQDNSNFNSDKFIEATK